MNFYTFFFSFLIIAILQLQLHTEAHHHSNHEKLQNGINTKIKQQPPCQICLIQSNTKIQSLLKIDTDFPVILSRLYHLDTYEITSKIKLEFYQESMPRGPPYIS